MAIITTFMESVYIDATIITEFVLESGPVLAGPTGPVPPAGPGNHVVPSKITRSIYSTVTTCREITSMMIIFYTESFEDVDRKMIVEPQIGLSFDLTTYSLAQFCRHKLPGNCVIFPQVTHTIH